MTTLPNDIFIHCEGKTIRLYFELEVNGGVPNSEFYSLINPRPYFVVGCGDDHQATHSIPAPSSIILLLLGLLLLLPRKRKP